MIATYKRTEVGSPSFNALEARAPRAKHAAQPTAPAMPGSWLATQGRLPLAFMMLALAWLAVAGAIMSVHPELLTLPHVHPRVVALTHAWVLGFFVTVACGAVYQLAPVALGTTLASERHGWWHFGLHAAGVPGIVSAFWIWDMKLVGHFGTAVALGILLLSTNVWRTVWRARRGGVVALSLVLSAGWILLTVTVGLVLAANRFWGFIALDPVALLRAHAHLGLVGFFLTLLQGVAFQLVPMFTLGQVRDWRLARWGQWGVQIGLLVLAPGLAWHFSWIAFGGALVIAAGLISSALGLAQALSTRKKRQLDVGVSVFLAGGAFLCVASFAGVVLAVPGTPWGSAPGGFGAMVYAVFALGLGLLPCVAGMLCKIVPFLTWMRAYGPLVGRGATPSAAALTRPRLERWAFGLQATALVPLLIGVWRLDTFLLRIGVLVLAAGIAALLADLTCVMSHLRKPERRVLAAGQKS